MTMQNLEALAIQGRMIPDARVQDSQTITIDAPIEKVWAIQTDVDHWPEWYSYLSNAELQGPFGPGARLTYGGVLKHHLTVTKSDGPHLVMICGTYMGFSAITKWQFEALSETQTQVTFSESSVGFLLSLLYSNEKLREHLRRWLERLKAQAETA